MLIHIIGIINYLGMQFLTLLVSILDISYTIGILIFLGIELQYIFGIITFLDMEFFNNRLPYQGIYPDRYES